MVQHADIDHSGLTGVVSSYGSNANSVSSVAAGGASTAASRADHVHVGVTSLTHTSNTLSGPLTIVAQGSIGITKTNDTTIAINAVAGSGGSGSSDLAGKELDYAQITTNVSVTATAEGSADTVVTGASVAYDGTTVVLIEFFAPIWRPNGSAAGNIALWLYDGASSIGRIAFQSQEAATNNQWQPVYCARRLTPSNASHTYSIRSTVSTGTGQINAGAGGTGNDMPAFLRITRVTS